MTAVHDKLSHDLRILEQMAAEMEEYLSSDVLFWPMGQGDMPRLTLGGYLLRQHRLAALSELLSAEEQRRLAAAQRQYNETLAEKIVRFEQRAHQELRARLRQWAQFLTDLDTDSGDRDYYRSAVETRAIIAALVARLAMPPYRLEAAAQEALWTYDNNLRLRWRPGEFVWPEEWQPAYPTGDYWWLYGRPQ